MKKITILAATVMAFAALALSGCAGQDSEAAERGDKPTPVSTPAPSEPTTAPPLDPDYVWALSAEPRMAPLVKAGGEADAMKDTMHVATLDSAVSHGRSAAELYTQLADDLDALPTTPASALGRDSVGTFRDCADAYQAMASAMEQMDHAGIQSSTDYILECTDGIDAVNRRLEALA